MIPFRSKASANSNCNDDDGFLDIDEFLLGIQQKSTLASAKLDSSSIVRKVDNRTRGNSSVDSSCSTIGSTQDPIILSDNESVSTESNTDFSSLDINLTAKRNSDSPHVADNELIDSDSFGSGTTVISDRVVASLHQSDLKNDYLPKHLRQRDVTGNVCRKRLRTTAPIRLASAASTVSAALESTDLKEPQSRALIAALDQEREIGDIDEEIVVNGSTNDSNDEDYSDMSDATSSKIRGRPHSQKRVWQTKDTEDNDVEAPSTHYLDVLDQAIAATLSSSMQESEEIPIHGYFTLKTNALKVVYCLTFSQELLPRPQDWGQRQDCTTDLEEPQSAAPVTDPNHQ